MLSVAGKHDARRADGGRTLVALSLLGELGEVDRVLPGFRHLERGDSVKTDAYGGRRANDRVEAEDGKPCGSPAAEGKKRKQWPERDGQEELAGQASLDTNPVASPGRARSAGRPGSADLAPERLNEGRGLGNGGVARSDAPEVQLAPSPVAASSVDRARDANARGEDDERRADSLQRVEKWGGGLGRVEGGWSVIRQAGEREVKREFRRQRAVLCFDGGWAKSSTGEREEGWRGEERGSRLSRLRDVRDEGEAQAGQGQGEGRGREMPMGPATPASRRRSRRRPESARLRAAGRG